MPPRWPYHHFLSRRACQMAMLASGSLPTTRSAMPSMMALVAKLASGNWVIDSPQPATPSSVVILARQRCRSALKSLGSGYETGMASTLAILSTWSLLLTCSRCLGQDGPETFPVASVWHRSSLREVRRLRGRGEAAESTLHADQPDTERPGQRRNLDLQPPGRECVVVRGARADPARDGLPGRPGIEAEHGVGPAHVGVA